MPERCMPFNLKHFHYIIILTYCLTSCNGGSTQVTEKPAEKVKMFYYDKAFALDSTSKLRLDGYYLVRQIFGRYTTNGKDYSPHDPTYGYLQFFSDGFCKVGWWNGFFESPTEIKNEVQKNNAFGFWGIYKVNADTLYVEYLYNPSSPGVAPFEERNTLVGLIKKNELIVKQHANIKFSYPEVEKDSLTSSCIGTFINVHTDYDKMDNYLKKNTSYYK